MLSLALPCDGVGAEPEHCMKHDAGENWRFGVYSSDGGSYTVTYQHKPMTMFFFSKEFSKFRIIVPSGLYAVSTPSGEIVRKMTSGIDVAFQDGEATPVLSALSAGQPIMLENLESRKRFEVMPQGFREAYAEAQTIYQDFLQKIAAGRCNGGPLPPDDDEE